MSFVSIAAHTTSLFPLAAFHCRSPPSSIARTATLRLPNFVIAPSSTVGTQSINSVCLGTFSSSSSYSSSASLRSKIGTNIMADTTRSTCGIDEIRHRKRQLRKMIRKRLSSLPSADIETQSALVWERLRSLPAYQNCKSVGTFLSMEGEIQTDKMLERALREDGKTLYVPRVGLDFEMCEMDMIRVETDTGGDDRRMFYEDWPRNKWGIPEPPVLPVRAIASDASSSIARQGDIDLLIVPGLAFDGKGHRLGQGKGYYDRFIARMRGEQSDAGEERGPKSEPNSEKKLILVGVCLENQFVNEKEDTNVSDDLMIRGVPVSDHDFVMDVVLTPSATMVVEPLF